VLQAVETVLFDPGTLREDDALRLKGNQPRRRFPEACPSASPPREDTGGPTIWRRVPGPSQERTERQWHLRLLVVLDQVRKDQTSAGYAKQTHHESRRRP
jgi:hypothetical protein